MENRIKEYIVPQIDIVQTEHFRLLSDSNSEEEWTGDQLGKKMDFDESDWLPNDFIDYSDEWMNMSKEGDSSH